MTTKHWYQSKTLWLLFAQLLMIWAAFVTNEATVTASIGISMTTMAGVIIRFYTEKPIQRNNGGTEQ